MRKIKLKIRELIYKIPVDKQLHSMYGNYGFLLTFFPLYIYSTLGLIGAALVGIFVGGAITGFLKEDADATEHPAPFILPDGSSTPSFNINDILATVVGSIITAIIVVISVYLMIKNI